MAADQCVDAEKKEETEEPKGGEKADAALKAEDKAEPVTVAEKDVKSEETKEAKKEK